MTSDQLLALLLSRIQSALEASLFGVLIFGRRRGPPPLYLASCILVAVGASLSSFWILVNSSSMRWPTGFERTPDGIFTATDWLDIIFEAVAWVRCPHMILAAYVTTSFTVRVYVIARSKVGLEGEGY